MSASVLNDIERACVHRFVCPSLLVLLSVTWQLAAMGRNSLHSLGCGAAREHLIGRAIRARRLSSQGRPP